MQTLTSCLSVLQRQGSKHNSFLFQREETNAFKDLGTGNRIATWLFYVSAKKYGFFYFILVFVTEFIPCRINRNINHYYTFD